MTFAEVIGDPIAQSKSPLIHNFWLNQLGVDGKYLRARVASAGLADFLNMRRADATWRGCNVTIPHKRSVIPLLERIEPAAVALGAVNCIVIENDALAGYNTDLDGVSESLASTDLKGSKTALIGGGGAARAVLAYLANRGVDHIDILVRNPQAADGLSLLAPKAAVRILRLDAADTAFDGAAAIVNASPLGMRGAPAMSQFLLDSVGRHAAGATMFDLVTTPAETAFLTTARETGGQAIDGLTMLIGQARRAFRLFFGVPAPATGNELRTLLVTADRR